MLSPLTVSSLPPASPRLLLRIADRLRRDAFGTPLNGVVSILMVLGLAYLAWLFLDWSLFRAVWTKENVSACSDSSVGACWSVIDARYRLIFFGVYPYEEHWRSTSGCLAIIATVILSCLPWFWTTGRIIALWLLGFLTFYFLMEGSLLGLPQVTTDGWGGLALTLFMFASVVLIGMPLGLCLALMRRSHLPIIRLVSSLIIDFIRSLPLLVTLFSAAIVIPILLPDWLDGDKIWRVIIAFALFFACYQAEVFRGGFQAIPVGQWEAGSSLGLSYWRVFFLVILPQLFRHSLPATINMVVVTFKETALVTAIGFFDVLASSKNAYGTADWAPYYIEVLVFVSLIYWLFIFCLGQYGEYLKDRMKVHEG